MLYQTMPHAGEQANGDLYTGPVRGVEKKHNTWVDLQHGRRTGAAIATKEYFASGVYEVRMKVAPVKGVCSAVWTFHYEEVYPIDGSVPPRSAGHLPGASCFVS